MAATKKADMMQHVGNIMNLLGKQQDFNRSIGDYVSALGRGTKHLFKSEIGGTGGLLAGGLLGGAYGAVNPGNYVEKDKDGKPVVKDRNRMLGALRGLIAGGTAGGVFGRAIPHYLPESMTFGTPPKTAGYIEYSGNDPEELKWHNEYQQFLRKWKKEDMKDNNNNKNTKNKLKTASAFEFGAKVAFNFDPRILGGLGGAAIGGLGGAALGALDPGYEEDENGVRRRRSRLRAALSGALAGAGVGGLGGAAYGHFNGPQVNAFATKMRHMYNRNTPLPTPEVQVARDNHAAAGAEPFSDDLLGDNPAMAANR